MRWFHFISWVPAASWIFVQTYVERFDGWGQWAAAPLLLVPVAVSALFVGVGLLSAARYGNGGLERRDAIALGVAALPLLWFGARVALTDVSTALKWMLVGALVLAAVVGLDRLLLNLESRGWLFYRRTRGVRGGAMYHAQELGSVFTPGMKHVQEAHVQEEQEEDESGDPPVSDGEAKT